MRYHVCGVDMHRLITDLPFKVTETTIVILKDLPVLQCENCREYLVEDAVRERVGTETETRDEEEPAKAGLARNLSPTGRSLFK